MSLRRSQDAAHNRRPARDVNVRRRVSGPFVKSRSVSRTPGGSAELPKREASQAQARPSSQRSVSGRDRSRDDSQKTRAALQKQSQSQSHSRSQSQQQRQPLKLDEQPKAAKIPNVFDFLQQENSSESGDSEDTDHSNDTNDPNELNDSNDSDDPDDSNASNYSNEVTLSQDDKASSIPLPQTEHIPSASHGERKRSTSLVTVNSHRDFETLQRAHSSSPNQVPSLISKTSSEISQPHTPLDMYSASGPLQFGSNALADREPSMTEPCTSAGAQSGISTPVEMPPLDMPYVPEAYYTSHQEAAPMRRMPTPPRSPVDHYHNYNYNHNHNHSNRGDRTLRRKPKQQQHLVPSGYGFLASRLSSSRDDNHAHIPPLYRRFENVNHRVLLYLQDEIAQMEEDLRVLDEYEEMHRVAVAEQEGTAVLPDSRRVDVQAQFHSPLHYRRLSLMEGLVYKTEQYNNALSAFNKVLQTLPPASEEDVDTYRAWMREKRPIAAAEARFLKHTKDLVSLNTRPSHTTTQPALTAGPGLGPGAGPTPAAQPTAPPEPGDGNPPKYSPVTIASAAILLPILSFSMVSEFGGRLAIVTIVSISVAANCSGEVERLVASDNGWKYAALYVCFMMSAALFIS